MTLIHFSYVLPSKFEENESHVPLLVPNLIYAPHYGVSFPSLGSSDLELTVLPSMICVLPESMPTSCNGEPFLSFSHDGAPSRPFEIVEIPISKSGPPSSYDLCLVGNRGTGLP